MKRLPEYIFALFFAVYPFLNGVAEVCLMGVVTLCAGICVWKKCYRITVADALAGSVAAWIVASYFLFSHGKIEHSKIYEFAAICLVWFAVRNVENKKIIIRFILLGALAQVVFCGVQLLGFAESKHPFFAITGSFFNPGPLAGFLAVTLFTYPYLWNNRNKIWLATGFLSTILTIIYSGSRAAWVAIFVGAFIYFMPKINKRIAIIICIFVIILGAGLYFLRPESADGRLLVWKASASLFAESPLLGNGPEAFGREYMYNQATYLEDKLMSAEAGLADNVIYAFSEPVGVLCGYGIVGFLLFGAFIISLFVDTKSRSLIAGLAAWLVFGLFSYPADVGPLKLLFVIIAAMLAGETKTLQIIELKTPIKIVANILSLLLITATTINYLRPKSELNPEYLYAKAGKLFNDKKYLEAIPVFKQAAQIAPSSQLLADLGKCYYAAGRKQDAENILKTAINMTPAYATPAYELFDFYRREERHNEARHWAEYLIARKFKATNSVTLFARKQAREYLSTTTESDRSHK